jgi:phage gpG-like protein
MGSNLEYARIHQFGGTIKTKARSEIFIRTKYKSGAKKGQFKKLSKDMSKRKMGQGYTYGDGSIDIPARPYLVLQDEDVIQILNLMQTLF